MSSATAFDAVLEPAKARAEVPEAARRAHWVKRLPDVGFLVREIVDATVERNPVREAEACL